MRRKRQAITISLFPFLSILACVIGTLTLLIAGMIVGEVSSPYPSSEMDASADPKPAPMITDLDPLEENAEGQGREDTEGILSPGQGDLPLTRPGRGLEMPIIVDFFDPQHSRDLQAGFVSCERTGLLTNVAAADWKQARVAYDDIEASPELIDYLNGVAAEENGIVIFLVRPGGVPAFERALAVAERESVRTGNMPVPDGRPLDFSRVKQADGEGPQQAEGGL